MVGLVADGTLSRGLAKDVLRECLSEPKRPRQVVAERGLAQVSDEGALGALVDEIVAASPDEVARYVAGDAKTRKSLRGFFVGEVMRATANKANARRSRRATIAATEAAVSAAGQKSKRVNVTCPSSAGVRPMRAARQRAALNVTAAKTMQHAASIHCNAFDQNVKLAPGSTAGSANAGSAPGGYSSKKSRYGSLPCRMFSPYVW